MSVTTQDTDLATFPKGTQLALDVVGTGSAPTTGDGIGYTKLDIGGSGASNPVTASNPLPVALSNAAAVAKGTQGADAIPVQDLKDSGRSVLSLVYQNQASTTTTTVVAMTTLIQNSNWVSSTGVTAFNVPAGKTLRLSYFNATGRAAATTSTVGNAAQCIYVEVRVATTNTTTAIIAAPIAVALAVPVNVSGATTGLYEGNQVDADFGDGVEVVGGSSVYVGITYHCAITSTAVILHQAVATGFTY